ncbi:MAG: polyprenyl synthetase family protein [Actinobacteria bacterium]|nr:polyprenyl synthetase family protein [Actinomycetota bacterium]
MTATPAPRSIGDAIAELERHGLGVADTLAEVESRLRVQVQTSHAFVDRAAKYLMQAGGKRFRPLLVALASHLGDPDDPRIPDAGVVVELVHLATLYHDDVIDEATTRRGARSANARWDNTVAILTGDYLFARASELSADLGVEVTRIMARTIATLCEGQVLEVQGSRGALPPDVPRVEAGLDHYLKVVGDKTASLIATSCQLGALLSGCDAEVIARTREYGWNTGMAFQLSDDILDIASDRTESGKIPGTDLREGVRTLPVLFAVEAERGGELERLLDTDHLSDAAVSRALELLRSSPALERARVTAQDYADQAVKALDGLGDAAVVQALEELARFAVTRVG